MDKKNYLSPSEQEVYELIRNKQNEIVTNTQIKDLFPKIKNIKINKICSSLIKKGYLIPLSRGIYSIQEKSRKEPIISNPFKIALSMYKGYIGFSSALKLHGLLEYEPFAIYVVTNNKSREKAIGQYT